MRPTPARNSRGAYSPLCQKTSTVTSHRNGSQSRSALQRRPQNGCVSPRATSRRTRPMYRASASPTRSITISETMLKARRAKAVQGAFVKIVGRIDRMSLGDAGADGVVRVPAAAAEQRGLETLGRHPCRLLAHLRGRVAVAARPRVRRTGPVGVVAERARAGELASAL